MDRDLQPLASRGVASRQGLLFGEAKRTYPGVYTPSLVIFQESYFPSIPRDEDQLEIVRLSGFISRD